MKLFASVIAVSCVVLGACATVAPASKDFQFVVGGTVRDPEGQAIPDVTVRLKLKDVAFRGTETVKEGQVQTDAAGSFAFAYTVGQRHTEFALTFQKAGYVERVVSGSASPTARFMVTLIRN